MFKKIIIGTIIALGVYFGIYGYFWYTGNPEIVGNRIQNHRGYSMFFFISIVAIYYFQGINKLSNILILGIIVINTFILGDVFFKNNIGLTSGQFLTLFGLILLALAITYITHRIRYIFITIIGIGIVFVLLIGILPMYEYIPNIKDFITNQKTIISNPGANNEGKIIIKNNLGTKDIQLNTLTKQEIYIEETTQIHFLSKNKTGEKIFINIGNGAFINISPQSAISLQKSGTKATLQIIQGNIEYYIPEELSGNLYITGKYKGKYISGGFNNTRNIILQEFETRKQQFFISELGGKLLFHPVINKSIKFFLNILYSLNPKKFQNNINNYYKIQEYFNITDTDKENLLKNITGDKMKDTFNTLLFFIKKGSQETKINQWLK